MELILLRHAKSSWASPVDGDWQRELSPRGRRALPKLVAQLGHWLQELDLIVSSDACRARLTAEAVSQAYPSAQLLVLPELYGASAEELYAQLERFLGRGGTQVWVGHNPAMEQLLGRWLTTELNKFPTAAMARLKLDAEGRLQGPIALWTPKWGESKLT
ncbi:histidine phosphatase family protein [Ferrimonas sediminicola]|uniref:Histidine phosphatase family protein n=1 Tax=Ferrimonas sediminicola TaxID=2569538 RepID=A0A4U1BBY8_9GAMM|nr:histidine phosphatase family protein [Ferrimonas sediminicola]TKB48140.1 histidine phosphatase family protein [Ferrimonas sediminicola]